MHQDVFFFPAISSFRFHTSCALFWTSLHCLLPTFTCRMHLFQHLMMSPECKLAHETQLVFLLSVHLFQHLMMFPEHKIAHETQLVFLLSMHLMMLSSLWLLICFCMLHHTLPFFILPTSFMCAYTQLRLTCICRLHSLLLGLRLAPWILKFSITPSHKPWLIVQGLAGQFFIDHVHPFGAACASSNAGMIANAVIDIWKAEGIFPVPKCKDDLKFFHIPLPMDAFHDGDFSYDYDHSEMLCHIAPWGIPWHDEKGDDHFLFITTFIGFCWDIPWKLVSLPEDKRLKFHKHVH